jgi:redox-sensitive bicupin YhaK (pirin superfamily)
MKRVIGTYRSAAPHWVGDGFHVRNLFPSNDLGERISPFLLLDYAGPTEFPPTDEPRGVSEHPHRGFETVTIVYQGELDHRDSTGARGTIGPGDVQWMTAASGVVHEEKHREEFARRGGTLQMVQLWVNLPRADKVAPPGYQTLLAREIPVVELPDDAGRLRVIAGEYGGVKGPARTFTPIQVYDLRLNAGHEVTLSLPDGHNTAVVVLEGRARVNESPQLVSEAGLALFDTVGDGITVHAEADSLLLVLAGEPIREPVASYGPFVMNTQDELRQAVADYRSGKMGSLD